MSRRVLLVHPDMDALGALASALRSRGLVVANASDAFEAVEIAYQTRPDAVLVAEHLDRDGELSEAINVVPELVNTPVLRIPMSIRNTEDDAPYDGMSANVDGPDIDGLVARIADAAPRTSMIPPLSELRGTIEQMPLVDLIQLLTMNRRSGVLSVTTSGGAGEVRLEAGELVDAVFRRLEGEKAFYRLLGEREGHFAFVNGSVSDKARMSSATSVLLMESMRQVDEVARRRQELTPAGEALLVQERSVELARITDQKRESGETGSGRLIDDLTVMLQSPRTLDELLDDVAAPDLEILEALSELRRQGKVRRIPWTSLTTPLAPPEQMPALRSMVTRLVRKGFAAPPRLVIATSARNMPALAHAVRRIMDTGVPNEPPPRVNLARLLGTLRFGDGVELALIGLPMGEEFAPTWSLVLPGAAAVVRVEEAGGDRLKEICDAVEVPLVEAESLMGELDVADPEQITALVRSALETAIGV